MNEIYQGNLNKEQIVAIEEEGNVLLTACPGSGKTRVLTHKVCLALENMSNSKQRVIAVTFTNRAADEIRRRIDNFGISQEQFWSGTIHSFCLDWILIPYACFSDSLKNGFAIADEFFKNNELKLLKEKYEIHPRTEIDTRLGLDGEYLSSENKDILHEYRSVLEKNKLIDFDILLYEAYELLSGNMYIAKALSNLFPLICIDEYQDTQELQYQIICIIAKAGNGKCKLFFVGDKDQAIFGSLGGIAKNKNEIEILIGQEVKELHLSGNYRSTQRIINFYKIFQSNIIDINAIGPNAMETGLITYNNAVNKDKIEDEIAKLVEHSLKNGIPENEICIMAPQWWLITSAVKKLRNQFTGLKFDASGITPMSKFKNNIWYKISRLFLAEPSPMLFNSRRRWAKEVIEELCNVYQCSINDEYTTPKKILRLVNSINSSKTESIEYLKECILEFSTKLGFSEEHENPIHNQKTSFFAEMERRIVEDNYSPDVESLKAFYREGKGVSISSCQGVKGEEYDVVIAFGLLFGYIPNWKCYYNETVDHEIEAKKLLYVIASRAKKHLHLIAETGRTTKGGRRPLETTPSLCCINFDFDVLNNS